MLVRVVVLALAVCACGGDLGPPKLQPLPRPEQLPAVRGGEPRSERIANYVIAATLDPAKHQITATQTLTWTNTGESRVHELPFHLYLNAFKNEQSLFMRTSRGEMRGVRASPTGWGWIQIQSIQIGGVELVGTLVRRDPKDPDETVVELPLATPVEPKASIEVKIAFVAQLPEVFARTGYQGDFHLVAQWFPKIGVRTGPPGDERWECRPFHQFNEFFADFGTYDVTLTVPNTFVVAATGVLAASADLPNGTRTLTYHARDVHDFVWMADPYMETIAGIAIVEHGPVLVRVLYRPEQQEFAFRHLGAAIGAVERFSAAYVPYPWSILTVVDPPIDASMGAGGMEYQTLVTTAGDSVFARPGVRLPEYVTVHEIGHNWFQGMLASNEPAEPWLDEGVNEWADGKVMRALYGDGASVIDWMGWEAETGELVRAVLDDASELPTPIANAAALFPDDRAYSQTVYGQTMRAMKTLERHVGPLKLAAAMKAYAKQFAFKHPTGTDLFDTLETELGMDLGWFFEPAFREVGGMRLRVRTARCWPAHLPRGVFGEGAAKTLVTEIEAPDTGSFECEVVITNAGVVHVPVVIRLAFADATSQEVTWDARGAEHWKSFTVKASAPLTSVWIDPDDKIWLDSPMEHHYRIAGNGDASLRAAAWFAAHAQTLMQVIGP